MLVYDYNKPAHLILQLGKDQAKTLLAECKKQAAKRSAEQAGFEQEAVQTPPPAQCAAVQTPTGNTNQIITTAPVVRRLHINNMQRNNLTVRPAYQVLIFPLVQS